MADETYEELLAKSDEKIEFARFGDESILTISRAWLECFEQKMADHGMTVDQGRAELKQAVDQYWYHKLVLTKHGEEEPWESEDEYKTKSELAEKVLYSYIRAYLFAWAFKLLAAHDRAQGKESRECKVVVPDEKAKDGVREIKLEDSRGGAGVSD